MSKKDDDNPLEEIQKQLRDLMKNKNLQVAFAPFMQSMSSSDEDQDAEKPASVTETNRCYEQVRLKHSNRPFFRLTLVETFDMIGLVDHLLEMKEEVP